MGKHLYGNQKMIIFILKKERKRQMLSSQTHPVASVYCFLPDSPDHWRWAPGFPQKETRFPCISVIFSCLLNQGRCKYTALSFTLFHPFLHFFWPQLLQNENKRQKCHKVEAVFISRTCRTDELSFCALCPVWDTLALNQKMFLDPQGHLLLIAVIS